jgi:uncharacterized membrane protein
LIKFYRNGIIAHTETIPTSDYRDGKKANLKLYLKVGGIVAGIMILIMIIESYLKMKIESRKIENISEITYKQPITAVTRHN